MSSDLQPLFDAWFGVGREPVEHGRRKADLRLHWGELADVIDELTKGKQT